MRHWLRRAVCLLCHSLEKAGPGAFGGWTETADTSLCTFLAESHASTRQAARCSLRLLPRSRHWQLSARPPLQLPGLAKLRRPNWCGKQPPPHYRCSTHCGRSNFRTPPYSSIKAARCGRYCHLSCRVVGSILRNQFFRIIGCPLASGRGRRLLDERHGSRVGRPVPGRQRPGVGRRGTSFSNDSIPGWTSAKLAATSRPNRSALTLALISPLSM